MNPAEELAEIRKLLVKAGAPDVGDTTLDLVKFLVGPGAKVRLRQRPSDISESTLESIEALPGRLFEADLSEDAEETLLVLPALVAEVRAHRLFRGPAIRPVVRQFAAVMERELVENDHKGGWENIPVNVLLGHLCEEVAEVVESIEFGPGGEQTSIAKERAASLRRVARDFVRMGLIWEAKATAETASEAADIGNLALMVSDRLGALSDTPGKIVGARTW